MASSMLEAMEMYQAPGAGTKVTKLDVKEVLGRTEQALFEKLSATRKAHLEKVLDGRPDPLGDTTAADNIAFSLRGKVVVITGASRGIGEAIAVRFAGRGASVVILAQSTTENPSLPGTVQQAVRACVAAGGDAIAIKTDIADEGQVQAAIKDAMKNYGGVIDILVNCASVHFPQRCADMDVKRYDALANVNVKGAIVVSAACMPYVLLSKNPHVLTIAPAPRADKDWLSPHAAYSSSKIAMGFIARKIHAELNVQHGANVSVNTLWPRYAVATAATNFIGGETLVSMSRTPACVADAAFRIVTTPSRNFSNKNFIDQDVLSAIGITDFAPYNVDPTLEKPVDDFFLFSPERNLPKYGVVPRNAETGEVDFLGGAARQGGTQDSDKREVVLILIDKRDAWTHGLDVVKQLELDRPNRKLVFIVHTTEDAHDTTPFSLGFPGSAKEAKAFQGDLRDASVVAKLVDQASRVFFGIDAVVDMLLNQPLHDWENKSLVDATSVTFSRHFDVCVRASYLALRDIIPHLTKSSGKRRVISVTPPPTCDVFDADTNGVVALARVVRGLHLKGVASELADVHPRIALIGVWSESSSPLAAAVAKLLDAPENEKTLPLGSFWRAEDLIQSRPALDIKPAAWKQLVTVATAEPTYTGDTIEFPDIAEELARELKRVDALKIELKIGKGAVETSDELGDWQMV